MVRKKGTWISKTSKRYGVSNRFSYTVIALLSVILIATVIYAADLQTGVAPNPGHVLDRISAPAGCADNTFIKWTGGGWACETGASSPWTVITNGISYNSGSVGIGTNDPFAKLDIQYNDGINSNGILVRNSDTLSGTTFSLLNNVGAGINMRTYASGNPDEVFGVPGLSRSDIALIGASPGTKGLVFHTPDISTPIIFTVGPGPEKLRINYTGVFSTNLIVTNLMVDKITSSGPTPPFAVVLFRERVPLATCTGTCSIGSVGAASCIAGITDGLMSSCSTTSAYGCLCVKN